MASVFIPLPYGAKLIFEWTIDGQLCVNVQWCAKLSATAITPTDLINLTDSMDDYRVAMRTQQSSRMTAQKLTAIDWSVEDGAQNVVLPGALLTGTRTAESCPNNVAVCQSQKSGYTGRSRNGRSFLGGICEDQLTAGNLLLSSQAAAMANAYQTFKTSLNAAGFTPVVASFIQNGAPRAVALGTAITTVLYDQPTDSQRNRLPGRGV